MSIYLGEVLGASSRRSQRGGGRKRREVRTAPSGGVTELPKTLSVYVIERNGQPFAVAATPSEASAIGKNASAGAESVVKMGATVLVVFKDGKITYNALAGGNLSDGLGCLSCLFGAELGEVEQLDPETVRAAQKLFKQLQSDQQVQSVIRQIRQAVGV